MIALTPGRLLKSSLWLSLILLGAALIGVVVGHSEIDLFKALSNPDSVEYTILVEHRLPRVILAALVGAGLASSGAAFQALMRNPLADPFILGASGGAALGGTLAMSMGLGALTLAGVILPIVPIATFLGSLAALVLVYALASKSGRFSAVDVLLICSGHVPQDHGDRRKGTGTPFLAHGHFRRRTGRRLSIVDQSDLGCRGLCVSDASRTCA